MSLCWWLDWDWICLLCYVSIVYGMGDGYVYVICMNPWMLMFVYVDYDSCEANPQWSWTAYLFVWMGRRRAGVVVDCLVSAWIAGAISVIGLWILRVGSDLGCLSLWLF